MDREWVREYWPFLVGVLIIVVGNLYFFVYLGQDWAPAGVPFGLAIIVVFLIEAGRALYRRFV